MAPLEAVQQRNERDQVIRRLWMFWSGLSLGSKLQYIALGLILGAVFTYRDLNPRMRWFGLPLWQITLPLILLTIVMGRLLLPLMLKHPTRTQRFLALFGWLVFGLGILISTQKWGRRLMLVQVGFTTLMWLDLSCWFWFLSEIQLRAAAMLAAQPLLDVDATESDEEQEEHV